MIQQELFNRILWSRVSAHTFVNKYNSTKITAIIQMKSCQELIKL